jgi:nucleoside-diphosphate-sugar epimerase
VKRVIVTGATGFIGRRCAELLASDSAEIHLVSSRQVSESVPHGIWHQCDLLSGDETRSLLERVRPTHLLHLAWETTPPDYWGSPKNLRWICASVDLLVIFQQLGGTRAVLAGTCAEYAWNHGTCNETETPIAPATVYGKSKAAFHFAAEALAQLSGLPLAWGRVFYTFGPGEHPSRLVPSIIRSLIEDKTFLCRHPSAVRDFMFVDDLADAFVALLGCNVNGTVNLASGVQVRLGDLARNIACRLGKEGLLQLTDEAEEGHIDVISADTNRLTHLVGWQPKIGIQEGISRTINWWRDSERRGWRV